MVSNARVEPDGHPNRAVDLKNAATRHDFIEEEKPDTIASDSESEGGYEDNLTPLERERREEMAAAHRYRETVGM
jgi:hypothetical protein